MKYTIDDIKELLRIILKFNIYTELNYIPEFVIEDKEKVYGLYYGGGYKISLGPDIRIKHIYHKLNENNLDEISKDIHKELSRDVSDALWKTMKELEWEPEQLKYFKNKEEEDNWKLFQKTIKNHIKNI